MKGTFPIDKFATRPTPFYYYDTALLRQTLDALRGAVGSDDSIHVHYALKANAHASLLRHIAAAGLGADCVSGGEIRAALQAGIPAEKILFAGVGKADWEIALALEHDIGAFNVESLPELEVVNSLAASKGTVARVALRINPDVRAHTHASITTGMAENKFGISMADIDEVIARAQALTSIRFIGLHCHIGSQIVDMTDFIALCNRLNALQEALAKRHIVIESINVGGGLGVSYDHPDRAPIAAFKEYFDVFARHLRRRPGQQLHCELGRAIVAQCGTLITRVLYVKQGTAKQFCILDAGFTDLIRPAFYQAYHKIENLTSDEAPQTYDVVGPICESSDVFAKAIDLPRVRRGDLIALRSAGAYGETMASQYNCRPLPVGVTTEEL